MFRPIAMKKGELARLYFPDAGTATANQRLIRWINRCQPLKEDLRALGYTPRQRLLTSRMVKLILQELGEPQEESCKSS